MTAAERALCTLDRCRILHNYDGGTCASCIEAALLAHEAEVREEIIATIRPLLASVEDKKRVTAAIRDSGREKERE